MDIRRRARSYANIPSGEPINVENYLTIVALEDGLTAKLSLNACEYCIDGDGKWKKITANTETKSINTGQTLSFRGELTPNTSNGIGTFTINKKCNLKGNCTSMIYGDEAETKGFSLYGKHGAFIKLFKACPVVRVSDNFLPSTHLSNYCYLDMFYDCTQLILAPDLPAKSVEWYSYQAMFRGCTSLGYPPDISGTSLQTGCYRSMFAGCSSLTTCPILGAATLAKSCYEGMFVNCTSLRDYTISLNASTLAEYCYYEMFKGCTSITTAPNLSVINLEPYCYSRMFSGCTNLTTAPALPSHMLCEGCYSEMFTYCTKLTTAPELPAADLSTGCYNYMFQQCHSLNYVKALFLGTPSTEYTNSWLAGVTSTGTFVKNSAAT